MNTTKLIGDKALIGLEYLPRPDEADPFLRTRLWLCGFPVGTLDGETYLPSFLHALVWFSAKLSGAYSGIPNEASELWLLSLGESFDDFAVEWGRDETRVVFIVQLAQKPYFSYDLPKGGNSHRAVLPIRSLVELFVTARQQLSSGVERHAPTQHPK